VLLVREGKGAPDGFSTWDQLTEHEAPLAFEPVPFDHPLWVLYSSGTTGLPKPIVHGHGGILIEHLKALSLHCNLGESDRFFWFSTTGWMMWNFLISGLLLGSTIVLYEGSPGYPDLDALWRLAADERLTYFGTSAPYLLACRKEGIAPGKKFDLTSLHSVGSTGAPLPVEGFSWVYENVSRDVLLGSVSGGTDVCTAFVISCPLLPVHAGELQCNALGAKVEAFDANGKPVIGSLGELVITEPMPSMPVFFLNDPSGERYRSSYFENYPGVWRHGDWIKITDRGTSVIYGRSDSTLNRGGVRMGTSEFYRVVEELPEVADSVVVDTGNLTDEGKLWLFVVPSASATWSEASVKTIRDTLRSRVSPRHVPDYVLVVRQVPRTINGKKLEVPIKKILMGTPREKALNEDTLANPESIEELLHKVAEVTGPGTE
jgi:acetoacetyl-CoA synthetase